MEVPLLILFLLGAIILFSWAVIKFDSYEEKNEKKRKEVLVKQELMWNSNAIETLKKNNKSPTPNEFTEKILERFENERQYNLIKIEQDKDRAKSIERLEKEIREGKGETKLGFKPLFSNNSMLQILKSANRLSEQEDRKKRVEQKRLSNIAEEEDRKKRVEQKRLSNIEEEGRKERLEQNKRTKSPKRTSSGITYKNCVRCGDYHNAMYNYCAVCNGKVVRHAEE